MATANFTFAPDPQTISLVDHFVLTTYDSNGGVVNNQTLPPTATSASVANLTPGAPYRTMLQAVNASAVSDPHPPSANYVVPQPPPTVPGDPTLNPPAFSFP